MAGTGPDPIVVHEVEAGLRRKIDKMKEMDLPSEGVELILRFIEYMEYEEGVGTHRQSSYVTLLRGVLEVLRERFVKPTRADIKALMDELQGRAYSDWTLTNYRTAIKRFYKWHMGDNEAYPPEVRWLKKKRMSNKILPENLLTKAEVKRLISGCRNNRDKAFIALLYDSGCRIGEILQMRVSSFHTDEMGAVLMVPKEGKTGARRVRIIGDSIPLMLSWLEVHPRRTEPNAPLWVSLHKNKLGEPMAYPASLKILKSAQQRAGITKRIYPHLFRHTRATELARSISEAPLESQMGWVHGSGMTKEYVHLSGKDVDIAMLKAEGMDIPEEVLGDTRKPPVVCSRCEAVNLSDAAYCRRCGMPQTPEAVAEVEKVKGEALTGISDESIQDAMLNDPEVQAMLKLLLAKMAHK